MATAIGKIPQRTKRFFFIDAVTQGVGMKYGGNQGTNIKFAFAGDNGSKGCR